MREANSQPPLTITHHLQEQHEIQIPSELKNPDLWSLVPCSMVYKVAMNQREGPNCQAKVKFEPLM